MLPLEAAAETLAVAFETRFTFPLAFNWEVPPTVTRLSFTPTATAKDTGSLPVVAAALTFIWESAWAVMSPPAVSFALRISTMASVMATPTARGTKRAASFSLLTSRLLTALATMLMLPMRAVMAP